MQLRSLFIFIASLSWLGFAQAQEVLQTDAGLPWKPSLGVARHHSASTSLRTTTLSLPFFDDFSSDSLYPAASRWAIHPDDSRRPALSNQTGHNVPSKGVATFDGVNYRGVKYQVELGAGLADTLASQPIDLSLLNPSDSIYLSFFVQRGGTGEPPEASDSLVVYFDRTGDFDYVQAWALHGKGTSESQFQHYRIPLASPVFFHDAFRFKFVAYGSLNGELDQFHLDYVQLDSRSTSANDNFHDRSVTRIVRSPMHPWTAVPRTLYVDGGYMTGTEVVVSNVANPPASLDLALTMADPTGRNSFTGTLTGTASSPSLAPYAHDSLAVAAFSDQSANIAAAGVMRVSAAAASGPGGDLHPQNDSVHFDYRLDSILALDDGVSDYAYGLLAPRAFCQEYQIPHPDTLVAVWIHFAPSIHYDNNTGQSTDLEGKGFRLSVWDSLSVDSTLVETSGGMNVSYGDMPNQFIRYPLIKQVRVPSTFWVGLRQSDGRPVGMGFDKNTAQRRVYYENSSGKFLLSSNVGALMMRPEFKYPSGPVGVAPALSRPSLEFRVAPNPATGGRLRMIFPDGKPLRSVTAELTDLHGRLLQSWESDVDGRELNLPLADAVPGGLYLLHLRARDGNGKNISAWEKLMIEHR
jgi:hypothetical protein